MTAERESMTLQRDGRSGPGGRGASRRGPQGRSQPRAANAGPGGRGQAEEACKFTAQYRLRILEEAESCTQPGEVGRLLRREGLYSSHLTEWRRARREGSLQGLTPSKRGRKPAERNPLSAKVPSSRRKWLGWSELHTAHTILDVQGKVAGLLGFSLTREGLLMAVQPLASQVGVAPACRALGVPRASFYRRQRPAPGHQQPRPTPARALCASERAHVLDVLASPRFVDRSPAEVVATLLDEGQYLCAERRCTFPGREPAGARAAQSAQSSLLQPSPSCCGHGPQPDLVLGYTRRVAQTRRPSDLDVLLDIFSRMRRECWMGRSGERRARRDADRGNLSHVEARHRAPGAHDAFGPRRADDQQVYRPTPRRPRSVTTNCCSRPQVSGPVLRSAVQALKGRGCPWALRRH